MKEIFERACCRDFDSSREVSKEQLQLMMEAGQAAPSVKNRQPYYFIAIMNRECRREIYLAAEKGRRKQFANLSEKELLEMSKGEVGSNDISIYEASCAILVVRDSDISYAEAKNQSENLNIKEEESVANAAYSIMLQAQSMGISSGWVCSPLYIQEDLKRILQKYNVKWNDNWKPRVIIPLGYCKKGHTKPKRQELTTKSVIVE